MNAPESAVANPRQEKLEVLRETLGPVEGEKKSSSELIVREYMAIAKRSVPGIKKVLKRRSREISQEVGSPLPRSRKAIHLVGEVKGASRSVPKSAKGLKETGTLDREMKGNDGPPESGVAEISLEDRLHRLEGFVTRLKMDLTQIPVAAVDQVFRYMAESYESVATVYRVDEMCQKYKGCDFRVAFSVFGLLAAPRYSLLEPVADSGGLAYSPSVEFHHQVTLGGNLYDRVRYLSDRISQLRESTSKGGAAFEEAEAYRNELRKLERLDTQVQRKKFITDLKRLRGGSFKREIELKPNESNPSDSGQAPPT